MNTEEIEQYANELQEKAFGSHTHTTVDNCMYQVKLSYAAGYRAALTALLEKLPEPSEHLFNNYNKGLLDGQDKYREKIKSLIQSKLK